MDRRKKRTSTNQYVMYFEMMEKDNIFATGRVPRDVDGNYLQKKWKELADKLNMCNSGPRLTAEEWRKRLNDWKNTTRCKYRRSLSGEKDIHLTSLELRALDLFGKVPNTTLDAPTLSIHLKSEKKDPDEEFEHQPTSESFHKELQAAVEEAIGGDDEDVLSENQDDHEDVINESINVEGAVSSAPTTAAYRTIVVDNTQFSDEENLEFITHRRHTLGPTTTVAAGVQTLVTGSGSSTSVTKLINGEIPLKRLRTHAPEQIIYEVKKATLPQTRSITIHNSGATQNNSPQQHHQHQPQQQQSQINPVVSVDTQELAQQLKRLADIKAEKLKFEIARFKFNNPGFQFNFPPL